MAHRRRRDSERGGVAPGHKRWSYDKDLGRGKWFIVDGDERDGGVTRTSGRGTPLLLSGPRVNRVLASTIENPAQYGLEPPESVIVITEETGRSYEFWLGNRTPDEGYNYMRLVGDAQLFTVPEIWATVVNRLVTEPPHIPPPLELGYFYEEDFRDIQELAITHNGITVIYAPEPGERTWYATIGDERKATPGTGVVALAVAMVWATRQTGRPRKSWRLACRRGRSETIRNTDLEPPDTTIQDQDAREDA